MKTAAGKSATAAITGGLILGGLLMAAGSVAAQGEGAATDLKPVILKHRVEVTAADPEGAGRRAIDIAVEKTTAAPSSGANGAGIERDEWASALDELKLALAGSTTMRVTEKAVAGKESVAAAPYILQARFGRTADGFRVFLRLVERSGGGLTAATDGQGATLNAAIRQALGGIEKELLQKPWRCRISDVAQGEMVLAFGRLDGFQRDQVVWGYSMAQAWRTNASAELNDIALRKWGTRAGQYRVKEAGEQVTVLEPLKGAPELVAGDVIEAPRAALRNIPTSSTSTVWDQIYREEDSAK